MKTRPAAAGETAAISADADKRHGETPRVSVVVLNAAKHADLFEEIRRRESLPIEIVHAEYRVPWDEISARRRGDAPPPAEPVSNDVRAALSGADVLFAFHVPRRLPELAPRLRWLATPSTGIDHLRDTGVLESAIEVTSVGGLFAPLLAEHVFAAMLYFAKRLGRFDELRRERVWRMERIGALEGKTVGIIGIGNIGSAVATRAKAFGMRVIGVGRRAPVGRIVPGIDLLLAREDLASLLRESDYVVIAAADTPETRGMIGAAEMAQLPKGAVLVNVARGSIVDEAALVEALRAGHIAGAALDVFEREPLSPESPLWVLPNALVTPHVAVNVPDYLPRAIRHFADNLRRFVSGEPLGDRYNRTRGY